MVEHPKVQMCQRMTTKTYLGVSQREDIRWQRLAGQAKQREDVDCHQHNLQPTARTAGRTSTLVKPKQMMEKIHAKICIWAHKCSGRSDPDRTCLHQCSQTHFAMSPRTERSRTGDGLLPLRRRTSTPRSHTTVLKLSRSSPHRPSSLPQDWHRTRETMRHQQ